MAKDKKNDVLSDLVAGYNKMMEDPKEYAQTTYAAQIKSQGRPYGGDRDARNRANKPWDKNDVPV
jgi:hypothetical protein